jgi:hypothetical protein
MRKRFNTLNEEINRMKSLFTEERLFGNLVTEGNLKVGSKGDGVKGLQKLLGLKVDGIFGDKTKNAVINMQKENGLNPDGVVGTKTMDAINKKYNVVLKESFIFEQDIKTVHGMMDAIEAMNKEINNKIIDKEKTEEKKKEEEGGKKEKKDFPDADGDGVPDSIDKDSGNTPEPVKGPKGKTSSTKVTKGEDGTETTVTQSGDGTSSTKVTKGEDGVDDKDGEESGTYDDQKGEEEDDGPKKAGTDRQGTEFYQKGKRKNTVKSVLASVKRDKGEINDNVKACKKGMKEIYKQTTKIGNAEMNLTDEELKGLDWCVSTFKNRFDKLGIGIGMEEMEQTYDLLNRKIPELESSVEGETYEVKDSGGLRVAKLKVVGPGKYKFNGRKGYTIATKNRKSGRMQINKDFKEYFLKTLKKDPNTYKVVTLHKKTGKNNGFFAIRKK